MEIQLSADVSEVHGVAHARYRIHLAEALDAFEAVRREWEELEAAAEEYSLCLTYRYCKLAAAHAIANGGLVVVVMVYENHDLLEIWPLAIHRKGMLRIANVMTCGSHEEYGGPLVKGRATASVVAECVRAVMQSAWPCDGNSVVVLPDFSHTASTWQDGRFCSRKYKGTSCAALVAAVTAAFSWGARRGRRSQSGRQARCRGQWASAHARGCGSARECDDASAPRNT